MKFQNFLPKLKKHLLPRIYQSLLDEARLEEAGNANIPHIELLKSLVKTSTEEPDFLGTPEAISDAEKVYFHSDRLYEHNTLHINYTSYDLRRETDVINPKTSRRHVMCLRQAEDDPDDAPSPEAQGHSPSSSSHSSQPPPSHRFIHARVLGIFHTNVVYRGRGALDLRRRRFDFLFVRWFTFVEDEPAQGSLDRLELSPLSSPDAIGFLDPADVLRASHIIPRYALGPVYPDNDGSHRLYPSKGQSDPIVSKQARDWEDWVEYYVNQ